MSKYLSKTSPARSRAAVNKSIQLKSANKMRNSHARFNNVETTEDEKLDESFLRTFDIATALLPVVPFRHRKTVDKWMRKFLDPTASPKLTRNIYISFLVFQIQNFQITEPFDSDPPSLIDAQPKYFSAAKWTALYKDCDDNIDFLNSISPTAHQNLSGNIPLIGHFFDEHPQPNNGLVAYGCVFSDHF